MGATLVEALMGHGELNLDLDYDADLVAELKHYRTLHVYQGETPIGPGFILLWRTPARGGIPIGGRALDWRLGQDGDGAMILDREYLACTNKLSEPGFELEGLYWRRREGTKWVIRSVAGEPYADDWAAVVVGSPDKDDVLATDEGGWEAREGNQFVARLRARQPGATTFPLRLRQVFTGLFDPPQLLTNGGFVDATGWTNTSEVAGDAAIESGHLRIGPTTQIQTIPNSGFETGDLTAWSDQNGTWDVISTGSIYRGSHVVRASEGALEGGVGYQTLQSDAIPGGAVNPQIVKPGERWRPEMWASTPDPIDEDGGTARVSTLLINDDYDFFDESTKKWVDSPVITPDESAATSWRLSSHEIDIPDDIKYMVPTVVIRDFNTGAWRFDDVTTTRVKGNKASYRHSTFAVTPERTYHVLAQVTPDAALLEGTLRAVVLLTAAGRPSVTLESPTLERGEATQQLLAWDFTPPSGYDTAALSFVGADVYGGSFIIDNASVTDADRSTVVNDLVVGPTKAAWDPEVTFTTAPAPAGTESVDLYIVAEAGATGWVVDSASLARVGTPAVSGDVIRSLLLDPDSGLPLMEPGDIYGDDTLLFDKHYLRQDAHSILKDVSRNGVVSPVREFFVDHDNRLHWGTAEQLFTDRLDMGPLTAADLELLDEPTVEQNVEDRVTDVIVMGAERQLADGRRVTIIGYASNEPGPDDLDYYGRPLRRTRVIEDSTVDHKAYADSLARWHLDQSNALASVVQLRLSSLRARGPLNVGDWIYPWLPEADLEDLARPMDHDGRTTFPERVRALMRETQMGAGEFRVEARAPDGSTLDISSAIRWEDATTMTLTVGDVAPEFLFDPQGDAQGNQFLRWRSSRPQ
ncbi:MAG: trimeric autotransporter adhesin [Actinomycetota bacterium]|jgi:hypothetical protein